MQEKFEDDVVPQDPTFRSFLRDHRPSVLLILLLAAVVRVGFVTANRDFRMEPRYHPTAINLLAGRGFSIDQSPPYRPSEAAAPAYPLFIAAVYGVFGRHQIALGLSQAFLDLLTCLLTAYVSFQLAPSRLKRRAAIAALIIYGIFSWPTIVWIPLYLAETLTLFLMMLAVALCAAALRHGARYWFGAGLACGLAMLTRPDSALLTSAVILFLLIRWAWRPARGGAAAASVLGFCLAVAFTLTPWIVRNYISLGKFQPLASEYGHVRDSYFPTGYLWWVRTWLKDETLFEYAFSPAWHPEITYFDSGQLPGNSYDSEEQRLRLVNLIARYNQVRLLTPEIDREFRDIAHERIRHAPLRFFLLLPLYRTASMWLTGFSTSRPTPYVLLLRIFSVLPIHLGGILFFALWGRNQPLAALLVLIVLTRTAFMAYHYAPETRYMAEIYPPMIAACGVTAAALWSFVVKRMVKFKASGERATP